MGFSGPNLVDAARAAGVGRGDRLALAFGPGVGLGLAAVDGSWQVAVAAEDPAPLVAALEDGIRPRWVLWSNASAADLVLAGVRVAAGWDIAATHRLLYGGWRADPGWVWAQAHRLDPIGLPIAAPPNLFTQGQVGEGDPEDPRRPDGYLRPDWVDGGWAERPERLARWAAAAASLARLQDAALAELPHAAATARSESAAELLCAEMSADGLPLDRSVAEAIIAGYIGPRPRNEAEANERRRARDAEVLVQVPGAAQVDLRSSGQVRSLLARVGIDVPDTRASRLTALRDTHPLVPALLAWRKAERIATTYGYGWLDRHVGGDGRLRGTWTGSDGAAGRMTASGGLHNMPADLRPAVIAEEGQVFVRADLGQIEPRVLAAVSGDAALARAGAEDDMYAPVAAQLGVDRATAKVAVLGAMYGQTTGHGAQALRRLRDAYPVAMSYLEDADRSGRVGRDLRTYGGRLLVMRAGDGDEGGAGEPAARVAARGRYARNAMVQGAAAELFKVWAATVRARVAPFGARIVLCLHDELLIQAPQASTLDVVRVVEDGLGEAARRWAPDAPVRFVADIGVIARWSDAKG